MLPVRGASSFQIFLQQSIYISTNLSSQVRIFFRKCKQKSGNIHTQLQKMPNNIFFQKIKARYIFSEFFEVPQIVLGSQKSKL